jgi:hypothetical protein
MIAAQEKQELCLNKEQYTVYSCICYFQVFHYPVFEKEILEFCDQVITPAELRFALIGLKEMGYVTELQSYFSTDRNIKEQIQKRLSSERRFQSKLKTIKRFANFISRFPFVEFVGISGSSSRGLFESDGDVDYFIITSPGKMWLCRTLLILFKKIFLLNSKKYFCLNYFIDATALEIPDRNTFVAHEIRSIAPVNNCDLFETFLAVNEWTNDFLPNRTEYKKWFLNNKKSSRFTARAIEFLLNNRFGAALDQWCFDITRNTWKKRFSDLPQEDFEHRFRSRKNVSKHHPRGFQKKVLAELQQRLFNVKVLA